MSRQSKAPSPARSQGAPVTPKRYKLRSSCSVGSPASSTGPGRLSAIIMEEEESIFNVSQINFQSVLSDNTDIEEPRRKSWWKKLDDNSRDVREVLENHKMMVDVAGDDALDFEVIGKENTNFDLPESSDNESIASIVVPQRKLFVHKQSEAQPPRKYEQCVNARDTTSDNTKSDKTLNVHVAPKSLFKQPCKTKSRPVFPAALLDMSLNKTENTTKKPLQPKKGQRQSLFGNRASTKRKNIFANFILSESEDETPEIQAKIFAFPKRTEAKRCSASSSGKENSLANSVTEMDEWTHLPSSTMVENQLEKLIMHDETDGKMLKDVNELEEHQAMTEKVGREDHEQKTKIVMVDKKTELIQNDAQRTFDKIFALEEDGEKMCVDDFELGNETGQNNGDDIVEVNEYNENNKKNKELSNLGQIQNKEPRELSLIKEVNRKRLSQDLLENLSIENDGHIEANNSFENAIEQRITEEDMTKQNNNGDAVKVVDAVEFEEYEEHNKKEDIKESDAQNEEFEESNVQNKKVEESENHNKEDDEVEKIEDQCENVEESDALNEEVEESENHNKEVDENEEEEDDEVEEIEDQCENLEESDALNEVGKSDECYKEIEESDNVRESDEEKLDNGKSKIYEENNEENIKSTEEIDENIDIVDNDRVSSEKEHEKIEVGQVEREENKRNYEDGNIFQENFMQNITVLRVSIEENEGKYDEETQTNCLKPNEEQNEFNLEEQKVVEGGDEIDNNHEKIIEERQNLETSLQGQQIIEEDDNSEELIYDEEEIEQDSSDNEIEPSQNESQENVESDHNSVEEHDDNTNESHKSEEVEESNDKIETVTVKSPEVILHDTTKINVTISNQGRNTSIRKTKSIIYNNIAKPSLAPVRESIELSEGSRNSSAEGSGWDSHRTTRKTLRQTFGKDFSPRKSLRTLVLERSARRQAEIVRNETAMNSPQANSTEFPDMSAVNYADNDEPESDHEESRILRQATLENYLQNFKKENMERRLKIEQAVKDSLKPSYRNPLDDFVFKTTSRPNLKRKAPANTNRVSAKNKKIQSLIPLDALPEELLNDMQYKPPKRFQPSNASWITKRLYKFLETKLEPQYDYKARIRAEKLVETVYGFTTTLRRLDAAPQHAVDELKHEMARLNIVDTHFEFYNFFREYMPREICRKVIPDLMNSIPVPRNGVFSNIIPTR